MKGINTAGQSPAPGPMAPSAAKLRGIEPFVYSLAQPCPCKHGHGFASFVNNRWLKMFCCACTRYDKLDCIFKAFLRGVSLCFYR
jgi:hypothetical protein